MYMELLKDNPWLLIVVLFGIPALKYFFNGVVSVIKWGVEKYMDPMVAKVDKIQDIKNDTEEIKNKMRGDK